MKKQFLVLLLAFMGINPIFTQIPNGSIAPDWTATDLNNVSHNLYGMLNSGYTVFMDFSATWCHNCWDYHTSNAFKDLYNAHGPNGTNTVRVFLFEGDPSTNQACLSGSSGCPGGSQGNWVAGTPYPIIHQQGPSIADLYQISGYPTIFAICPSDKKVYEAGTLSASGLYDFHISYCSPMSLVIVTSSISPVKCFETNYWHH